jgi:hypothetical protein
MLLLTKATINRPVTFESSSNGPETRWGLGISADRRADPVHHAMARPLRWFMQEHFYEKPRNVFMQIDGHKSKVLF